MKAIVRVKTLIIAGLVLSVFLAFFISPFASKSPDGLEKVAERQNFLSLGDKLVWRHSLLAEYLFPGIKNERLATGLAGLTGTIVAFALAYMIAALLRRPGGRGGERRQDSNTSHRSG